MRVHAHCRVCGESIEYTHTTDDAYGVLSLDDWAIVGITVQDGDGSVREHMNAHYQDGSFQAVMAKWKGQS